MLRGADCKRWFIGTKPLVRHLRWLLDSRPGFQYTRENSFKRRPHKSSIHVHCCAPFKLTACIISALSANRVFTTCAHDWPAWTAEEQNPVAMLHERLPNGQRLHHSNGLAAPAKLVTAARLMLQRQPWTLTRSPLQWRVHAARKVPLPERPSGGARKRTSQDIKSGIAQWK